jgi:opacity protein-like surface antigen
MRYLKASLIALLLFAFSGLSQAQVSVAVHGGFNNTAFQEQESSASGIGVGASLDFTAIPILDVGVEFDYLVSPFEFSETILGQEVTSKISQTLIGIYGKIYMPMVVVDPYARVGVGYYMGKFKAEAAGETLFDQSFKNQIGFNVGVGVAALMGLYGEFVYHIVSREIEDIENPESFGYNYWAINIGYAF